MIVALTRPAIERMKILMQEKEVVVQASTIERASTLNNQVISNLFIDEAN